MFTKSKLKCSSHSHRTTRSGDRRQLQLELLEQRVVFNNYWVTNFNDSGNGSLRSAIEAANANRGDDTIRFRENLAGAIKLQSELRITDNVEIRGDRSDRNPVIISGENRTRVLRIEPGANVELDRLRIENGRVSDADGGGGILNRGVLSLRRSIISGNHSSGSTIVPPAPQPIVNNLGKGGGISNFGTLLVDDSKIVNNTAGQRGGGVNNEGTAEVEDSKIDGNKSGGQVVTSPFGTFTLRGESGGVQIGTPGQVSTATLKLIDSQVTHNKAGGDAAGLGVGRGASLLVKKSIDSDNEANQFGTGGIAVNGNLTLIDSKVTRNQGFVGGIYIGAYRSTALDSGKIRIFHSEISENRDSPNEQGSPGNGFGGMWATGGAADVLIEDSVIENNVARSRSDGMVGGLQISFGTLKLVRSTVSGNLGGSAGGVSNGYGELIIEQSTISDNHAVPKGPMAGGGIRGPAKILNSTISGNRVDASGLLVDVFPLDGPAVAGGWNAGLASETSFNSIASSTVTQNRVTNLPANVQAAGGVLGFSFSFEDYGYVFEGSADVKARNTIIAQNELNGIQDDVSGKFVSGGTNLIGVLDADASGFVASDLRGTLPDPLDPRLGPLAWNGGPTKTHLPRLFSPVINAGNNSDASVADQRGYVRIAFGRIDIGAVEAFSVPVWYFDPQESDEDREPLESSIKELDTAIDEVSRELDPSDELFEWQPSIENVVSRKSEEYAAAHRPLGVRLLESVSSDLDLPKFQVPSAT